MDLKRRVVLCVLAVQIVSVSCGVSIPKRVEEPENEVEKGLKMLYKVYQKCGETEDMFSCLKIRALRFADRAVKINNIPLFEGMSVVRNEEVGGRAFSAPEFDESKLPQDPEKRQETLDDLLVDRVTRFLKTHSVQLDMPKLVEDADNNEVEEGRGKMKKYMGPLLFAAMMKGGMMAYALKAVGILAAKALMVSKIALVLASVIGLKKLFHSGGHSESKTIEIVQKPQISHAHTYSSGHDFGGYGGGGGGGGQGWESSGHGSGGGGYGRSLDGSVPQTVEKASESTEVPVGNGVESVQRRSFDTSIPYPAAQELAYRGRRRHQQQ